MNKTKFASLRLPAMMLIWIVVLIVFMGCSPKVKAVIPPLGEQAVLETPLLERPALERLTPEELKVLPRTVKGKILRWGAGWWGYADVAEAAVKAHQDYERELFGGGKAKKPKE